MDYQIDKMIGDENTHRYVLASKGIKALSGNRSQSKYSE